MKTYRIIETEGRELEVNYRTALRLIMRRPITVHSAVWAVFSAIVSLVYSFFTIDPVVITVLTVATVLLFLVFLINVLTELRDFSKYKKGKLIEADVRKIVQFKPVLSGRTNEKMLRVYYFFIDKHGYQNIGSGYTKLNEMAVLLKEKGKVPILMLDNGSQCMLDYGVFDFQKHQGITGID